MPINGTTTESSVPLPGAAAPKFPTLDTGGTVEASVVSKSADGSRLQLSVAKTPEDIAKLRPFWEKLNEHPDADIDFYSLIVTSRSEVISPYVLVVSDNGEPTAMLIGRLEDTHIRYRAGYLTLSKLKVRQISVLQEGFLGDRSPETANAMVHRLIDDLKSGVADTAVLYNVDVDSELRRAARSLPAVLVRDRSREVAERWRTSLPGSLEEFLKRRSKKHRYWLKRIGRVFEEAHPGQVKYRVITKPEEVGDLCAVAEKVARKTYQRGLGVGFMNHSEDRWRLELAAKKGWLRSYVATISDEPVAFWCGRLYKDEMYLDWTGYDPAYRKYELGTVLFLKMVEDICRSGAQEMDYGSGGSFYKERFGDNHVVREVVSIYAPTLKGFIAGNLKSLESVANKKAKAAAEKLKVLDRVKRGWRGFLAGSSKDSESSSDSRNTAATAKSD